MLVVAIPKLECLSYTMETIRVEYKWKPTRCDECKIFFHSCDNFPKQPSTNKAQPKDRKQKDVPVVKPKSSTPVCNPFSAFEEDNGNSIDDLVDDTRKKLGAPPGRLVFGQVGMQTLLRET
nr:zinc knuckle CX2CX4HX4C [Tanacetum cinerariifolium]